MEHDVHYKLKTGENKSVKRASLPFSTLDIWVMTLSSVDIYENCLFLGWRIQIDSLISPPLYLPNVRNVLCLWRSALSIHLGIHGSGCNLGLWVFGFQVPGTRLLSSSIAYINDLPIIITVLELTNIVTNITLSLYSAAVGQCMLVKSCHSVLSGVEWNVLPVGFTSTRISKPRWPNRLQSYRVI